MSGKKRSHEGGKSGNQQQKKKYKVASGFIDPGTSGIYATCSRRHEKQAIQELGLLFEEKMTELYSKELKELNETEIDEDDEGIEKKKEELSIEDQIKQELADIQSKDSKVNKDGSIIKRKDPLNFIDLNCECVVFCKTRKPIVPEEFVSKIIKDLADPSSLEKRTRYVLKLTPITYSCNATMDQFILLLKRILTPHFHEGENATKKLKFAVDVTRRNFNTIERMDLITTVVKEVIQDGKYEHEVDLKNYDKLVLIECFKNNIGASVVDGSYTTKYRKFNVQQIYEQKFKDKDDKK
ncbi:hypothetical protein Kpol_460p12 [Vanderwaltozyma polyspora DSM 70294]|uniref:THUMP domain-containing protein n=1 Tax=Vanderwaltozyma polyspora (strain ATCC 22028 / DSM 70294 / BCRC 21397 / CBS 2163 / NBRC 10782 / NRRL Y-8283 / UCD 57-17) TaxID=436907 RepID=A7TQS8_VANPO|nr:uncharacterized protein Kpol_460p12 [Vanderwaltozyma polyspora DSM 70294]EDO15377.1 hypothetical protein Kpol_460p12 [Vanderwaltozyma polyspora DSM 70294]